MATKFYNPYERDPVNTNSNNNTEPRFIRKFDLDLSDLPASGEGRDFTISGNNADFILEIRNSINYYYNFTTNAFQAAKAVLEKSTRNNIYKGKIKFPSITKTDTVNGAVSSGVKVVMDTAVANTMAVGDKVTGNDFLNSNHVTVAALDPDGDNDNEFSLSEAVVLADDLKLFFNGDDQYDIKLHAKPGVRHNNYTEVRFGDGSIDINSSTGSNSLLLQKVIYQYADLFLKIVPNSPTSVTDLIKSSTRVDHVTTISRRKNGGKVPFKISCEVNNVAKCYQIKRQPDANDVFAFKSVTVGGAPENLPGENIYPTVSNTDTVDGVIAGGGSVVKVVMDNNVADKMVVGDKITAAVATDTVDGAVSSGIKVVMDNNVAAKMAVGDQVTGNAFLDANIVTVAALNPDTDNVKEFSLSEAVAISDGITLTFSPKCNRSLTTVAGLNPDEDNVKEFSMSQNVGLVDGVTLSFSNQVNYQWPLDDISKLSLGMFTRDTNVTAGSFISKYQDTVTIFENTEKEQIIVKNSAPGLSTKNQSPTVSKGLVTLQPGNIVFNKQQKLILAGDSLRISGYGENSILKLLDYNLKFSDLSITLQPISTTTTSASSSSTSVAVASRNGILDSVSTISGIGINPNFANPKVASGAGAVSGAGTIVLSAAQTLESGITLNVANTGQVAVITGNVEILKAGTANKEILFDVENLLSIT